MFEFASRAFALVAIVGLLLTALLPSPVATVNPRGLAADHPVLSSQPDDLSFVTLFASLLLPAPTQSELEEDQEDADEPERKLKALPVSYNSLGDLHYQLPNLDTRRPDTQTVANRSLAPDPRPPRA